MNADLYQRPVLDNFSKSLSDFSQMSPTVSPAGSSPKWYKECNLYNLCDSEDYIPGTEDEEETVSWETSNNSIKELSNNDSVILDLQEQIVINSIELEIEHNTLEPQSNQIIYEDEGSSPLQILSNINETFNNPLKELSNNDSTILNLQEQIIFPSDINSMKLEISPNTLEPQSNQIIYENEGSSTKGLQILSDINETSNNSIKELSNNDSTILNLQQQIVFPNDINSIELEMGPNTLKSQSNQMIYENEGSSSKGLQILSDITIGEVQSSTDKHDDTDNDIQIEEYGESDEDYIPSEDSECSLENDLRPAIYERKKSFMDENAEYEDKRHSNMTGDFITELPKVLPLSNKNTKKRTWNKKDLCFFCDLEVMKFSRHLLRHHSCEVEVQEILALPIGSKKRKILFNKLRNQGNFLKSTTEENVVPIRKPIPPFSEAATTSTYLPCKYCKGFYKKKFLCRHLKRCPLNSDSKLLKTHAQADGQSLLNNYKCNNILREEIFPTMRADSVSLTAKTDPLICAVAERYLKSHREKQFRIVVSRKMRQLASLSIAIRKEKPMIKLINILQPQYFDTLVNCTKTIARYDPETQTYGSPTLAANMGTLLKECIDVAYSMRLKCGGKTEDLEKLKILKELIINEWRYEISTIAINDLQQKKWNKASLIPLAEDLMLLKNYLLGQSKTLTQKLQQDTLDVKAFKALQEITYIQLILLNRRRVGELQRMTLSCYVTNINSNKISDEFDSCISDSERQLMKSFKRVVIRGKRGRGVPVLFTDQMAQNTDLLVRLRDKYVQNNNLYLFANINSTTSITGTKAIYKHVRLAGVKNKEALTSTKLRKHLATMSQIINLTHQDLEQLASFMGHTADIHKNFYRLPNDVYQTAKVSKLLLLSEKGQAAKYKGKTLDEIDVNLDSCEDASDEDPIDIRETSLSDGITNDQLLLDLNTNTSDKEDQQKHNILETKPRTKRVLIPWTTDEKRITQAYFKNHVKNKVPPKKMECLKLLEENLDIFKHKTWEKIKIYVVNTYNKNK